MRKIAIVIALLMSVSVLAATHYWSLVNEGKASNGKTICTYECAGISHGGQHVLSTSQWYSGCPYSP